MLDRRRDLVALQAEQGGQKQASLSTTDMLALLLMGSVPLAGITSGILTDSYLDQQSPTNRDLVRRGPTQMRLKNVGQDEKEEAPVTPAVKAAADALLCHMALEVTKAAGCGLRGLAGASLTGRLPEVIATLVTRGADAAIDQAQKYEHAWNSYPSKAAKQASLMVLVGSAAGPVACKLAALDFSDACPHFVKEAQDWMPDRRACDNFVKFASAVWNLAAFAHCASEGVAVKEAGAQDTMATIRQMLTAMKPTPGADVAMAMDSRGDGSGAATTAPGDTVDKLLQPQVLG